MRAHDFLITSYARLTADEQRRACTQTPLLEDKDLWIIYRAAVAFSPGDETQDRLRREVLDAVRSHPHAHTAVNQDAENAARAEEAAARVARRARNRGTYTPTRTREHAMTDHATLERTSRTVGAVLVVVGFVGAQYGVRVLTSRFDYVDFDIVEIVYDLTVGVAIPLGAGLLAASLVIRSLTLGVSAALVRGQLILAVALIVVGLVARAYGSGPAQAFYDFLGPTGTAGAEIAWLVLGLLTKVALPLGVALAAVWPIQRWVLRQEPALVG